ncbi:MAG: cupredoxin domain-containing protein, partial [Nitrososphaerales archaeon]
PGGTFEYTFPASGVYDYYCTYHPWMKGAVVVLPSELPSS